MNKAISKVFLIAGLLLTLAFWGYGNMQTSVEAAEKVTKADLKSKKEKFSYALGADIARNMKNNDISIDSKMFYEGLKAGMADKGAALMTDEEIRTVLDETRREQMQKRKEAQASQIKGNTAKGKRFLAEKEKEAGVVKLPSGLLYKVLKEGTGEMPKADDTIECHYRGTTIDGQEFDSSYKRNKPAKFQVNRVIKGWTEAIQKMKVGSKWQLFIPADLAYGNRSVGQKIPPGSTLVFEVELMNIESKK